MVLAAVLGAVSGLYDKYLMGRFNNMVVQAWYNVYQLFLMGGVLMFLWWPKRKSSTPFHWDWCIILISVFLSAADFVYFYALGMDGAMIFHRVYGATGKRGGFLPVWCHDIPREEPEEQGG